MTTATILVSAVSKTVVGCVGMSTGSVANQGGPSHHKWWSRSSDGKRPHEAQSAGLSSVGTCFHLGDGTSSRIDVILLATYVL